MSAASGCTCISKFYYGSVFIVIQIVNYVLRVRASCLDSHSEVDGSPYFQFHIINSFHDRIVFFNKEVMDAERFVTQSIRKIYGNKYF
jgi:hypothetical protein